MPAKLSAWNLKPNWNRALDLSSLVRYGLLAIAGVLTALSLCIAQCPTGLANNLEISWIAAYAHFFQHGFQCGRDYVFTYGPLAHLILQGYAPDLYLLTYVAGLAIAGLITGIVLRFSVCLSRPLASGAFFAFFIATQLLGDGRLPDRVQTFVILIAYAVMLAGLPRLSGRSVIAFATLLAFLSLFKLTLLFYSALASTLLTLTLLSERKGGLAGLACSTYAAAFVAGWMLSGQSAAHIPLFVRNSIEIVRGYEEAMAAAGPARWMNYGMAVCLTFVATISPLGKREFRYLAVPRQFLAVALIAAGLYLNWKQAFTRMDPYHTEGFFWFAAATLFVLPIVLPDYDWKQPLRKLALAACAVVAAIGFLDCLSAADPTQSLPARFAAGIERQIRAIAEPNAVRRLLAEERRQGESAWALPGIKAIVGRHTVDLISFEQGVLIVNDFNWRPRPIFQSYSAYTPRLQEMNAEFFGGDRRPDFAILKSEPIDGRFPTTEDALALEEILWRYEPVLVEKNYLLLKHRAIIEERRTIAVEERQILFGQEVAIPSAGADCQTMALQIRLSALGRARKLVGQLPRIELGIRTARGETYKYRLIREMAETGFLLNPLLWDDRQLLSFYSPDPGQRAVSFSLNCATRSCFEDEVKLVVKRFVKPSTANRKPEELRRIADH